MALRLCFLVLFLLSSSLVLINVATTTGIIAASGLIVAGAVPFYGAASGIDLATGASTDITPNPLNVKLIPETTPEETAALIEAFFRTRNMNAKNTAARTK